MTETKDNSNSNVSTSTKGQKEIANDTLPTISKSFNAIAKKANNALVNSKEAINKVVDSSKKKVVGALDADGNGELTIEDLILQALKLPWVKIDRASFLQKEFNLRYDQETISKAISTTPLQANISLEEINKVADSVIQSERLQVSGISAALGAPGGAAMAAAIPADIAQYYGYTLRAAQKLMYLYGFPEIMPSDCDAANIDSSTMNMLIMALGVMAGVAGANNAIKAMAKAFAVGLEKQLLKKALTKGTIYPIVKSIAKYFSIKMTKEVFAGFFKTAIPVIGGVLGGGITFLSFKPCCDRLKESLRDTELSNPKHKDTKEEIEIFDAITTEKVIVEA